MLQREYYATHQYFLSKRSIYLVVWKVTEGEKGVNDILQWLVNIQVSEGIKYKRQMAIRTEFLLQSITFFRLKLASIMTSCVI